MGDDIPLLRVNTAGVPAPFGRMVPAGAVRSGWMKWMA